MLLSRSASLSRVDILCYKAEVGSRSTIAAQKAFVKVSLGLSPIVHDKPAWKKNDGWLHERKFFATNFEHSASRSQVLTRSTISNQDTSPDTQDMIALAEPGDNLLEVAMSAGVDIPSSCLTGHCGSCEVEVEGWTVEGCANGSAKEVVRACVSPIPCGTRSLVVDELNDGVWGSE